jgi:hypothetical protein
LIRKEMCMSRETGARLRHVIEMGAVAPGTAGVGRKIDRGEPEGVAEGDAAQAAGGAAAPGSGQPDERPPGR